MLPAQVVDILKTQFVYFVITDQLCVKLSLLYFDFTSVEPTATNLCEIGRKDCNKSAIDRENRDRNEGWWDSVETITFN